MRQDAVIRKLEIIGEAVKQLSDGTRSRAPEIPWKQIAGMRDRLTQQLLRRGSRAGVDNGRTGTAAAEGRRRDLADARLNPVGWCAAGVLTAADSLYLFCTWTSAFERFSRLWRFGFPKVLGNMDFWADRLPPPPPV